MGIQFNNIPAELRQPDNWLLWRSEKASKVPYQPHKPTRKAKSTDPATWGSYDATKAAYRPRRDSGVGFVLDGTGCAAIDIDGDVSKRAIDLLHDAGCGYIEYSPSGNGLHGWGFHAGNLPRKKGVIDGINVEIYNDARYMSVTGDAIIATPFRELSATSLSSAIGATTPQGTQGTHGTHGTQVRLCVVDAVLRRFLPAQTGQRNSFEFRLAQYIRGQYPDASVFDCTGVVERWYELAKPTIGTKDWETTWLDFCRAFADVKYPAGTVTDSIIAGFKDDPLPPGVDPRISGYALDLSKLCYRLHTHGSPFPLSWRKAQEWLGTTDHKYAGKVIKALCAMKVIELVTPAEKVPGADATTYRFIAKEQTP